MNQSVNSSAGSIKLPGQDRPLALKAIVRLQGFGNYTWVYLSTQPRPMLVALTLKWFEAQLPGFVRVHKSELINPAFIRALVFDDALQSTVCLLGEYKAKVSRRRLEQVVAKLNRLASPKRKGPAYTLPKSTLIPELV
ncbi:LytTR family transcriptional regulator [Spirosoma sp. KCTC 42546]|uniref:LytTR family DNA-binding domain-containing protein n=1 Tax=Spirosoma sp. KCTC 42546 TaxID=2520506 RepID=UPI001158EF15|nr:LytTR family DNA-binding domain-containing protein [Spirosoma sp. KCTC 42546]QDK81599.1 LytTR family transcriptional regulator [Spirosoma sp. KCTC 42546]